MEIGNGMKIKKLKKVLGVVVPELLRDNPEVALEFVAGYVWGREIEYLQISPENGIKLLKEIGGMPSELLQICKSFGSPGSYSTVHNPAAEAYVAGYVASGRSLGSQKLEGKKAYEERELDAFEVMQRMRRNPEFIPSFAFPASEESRGSGEDFRYNFGRRALR